MAVTFSVEGCVHLQKCPFMWRMIVKRTVAGAFFAFQASESADTRVDSPVVLTIRIIKVDKQVQEILVDIKS